MVSLSTSNDSATATFAPFGQAAGWSERPARTVFTTVIALSMRPLPAGLRGGHRNGLRLRGEE